MRDDIEFNIKFCELVENHPELYDYNQSSYSNRSVQDKAWELIAQELNESATDCKERWKNIRGRYAKVLKAQVLPSGSATTRIKEYYLGPHLRFLNNFMKSRPSKSNIKAPVMSDDDNNTSGVESNSSLPKPTEGNSASPVSDYMPSTSSTPVIKNPPTLKDVHKSAYEFFSAKKQKLNKKTDSTDSELDLCFLKSVLPDMMAMTPLQKRRFKIGVLNLSFNILAENENITSTRARSESPFSRPYSGSSTYSNSCPPIYTETFQQNSETTAQQNSETTTQQNSETTTQQNSETTTQQNSETTTQQNSETTTQQNSETTTQQNSETTSNQDANVVPITTDTSRTTEAQNFYFLPQYSVISSISSQPPQSNDDLDLFQL